MLLSAGLSTTSGLYEVISCNYIHTSACEQMSSWRRSTSTRP